MERFTAIIILNLTLLVMTGCSTGLAPYDYDYPVYGGIHQRADPSHGRVGSIFSDPLYAAVGPSADSNLKPHPEAKVGVTDDQSDDDLDRAEEDLGDDFDELDREDRLLDDEIDALDREIRELDRRNSGGSELESIEPLEDVNNARPNTGNAAIQRWRRRAALPQRRTPRR